MSKSSKPISPATKQKAIKKPFGKRLSQGSPRFTGSTTNSYLSSLS